VAGFVTDEAASISRASTRAVLPSVANQWTAAALIPLVLTASSGWLCAQAFPVHGLREVAWFALVPFLVAARLSSSRSAAVLIGAIWMLVFAWGINDWFPPAVERYFQQPFAIGFAGFLAVTIFSAAPATMLFAAILQRIGSLPKAMAPPLVAAAWVLGEFARTRVLGDPWGLLGYSQAARPVWLQAADAGGIYAVGFVLVLGNAVLAELLLVIAARRQTTALAPALRGIAVCALVVPVVFTYGKWRLSQEHGATSLEVVVVQANIPASQQWAAAHELASLDRYHALTAEALAEQRADLVVWPENAVTFFLDREAELRRPLAATLARSRARLIAGAPHVERAETGDFRNSALLIDADGSVLARYDKQRLLPFAEYTPTALPDFVARDFGRVRQFHPGPEKASILDVDGARVGAVICNEALFSDPAAARVAAGADLLLALTNDSWVGDQKYAEQAFEKSVVRAVEQRRWLVRASTSGPSAIVDDRGRIVARTKTDESAVLRGAVATSTAESLYAAAGDLFAWLCVGAVAVWRWRVR
jgi:apolipoprotein N-acyltransferase